MHRAASGGAVAGKMGAFKTDAHDPVFVLFNRFFGEFFDLVHFPHDS